MLLRRLFNARRFASSHAGRVKSPVTEALWNLRNAQAGKGKIDDPEEEPSHLVAKTPAESAVELTYAFSSDPELAFRYRNAFGFVRMGIVLEDLDAMAGSIAFKHADDENPHTRPLLLVTASVDEIELKQKMSLDRDIVLRGQVAWVGRSSMEIKVNMHYADQKNGEEGGDLILEALFNFVAREQTTQKSAAINPLVPTTDTEQRWFREGQGRADTRKMLRAGGAQARLAQESAIQDQVRAMLEVSRPYASLPALAPGDTMLIADTKLTNTAVTQPQHQNTAGRVFGGFLMRRAFELAFSSAYIFSGARPHFLSIDEVTFSKPVEVGSLLQFESKVVYTDVEQGLVHVHVAAFITHPEERTTTLSNQFFFTFSVDDAGSGALRHVLPTTAEEARLQLEAMDMENVEF